MAEEDERRAAHDLTARLAQELSAAGLEDPQVVGFGGFGAVFRCVQPSLRRAVAVKVLIVGSDEENVARFLREQQAMAALTGAPNIVNIFDVGTTSRGRPYIVMQYCPSGSLDARIRQDGPLSVSETIRVGVSIAGALEEIHRNRILHRDVKPANILFTDRDEPVLSDFGIAHIAGGFETETGAITGSPAYTAPEVLRGDAPSIASDVYGLGATLFCAVTGHAAFERRNDEDVVAQFIRIAKEPVPDIGIPGPLQVVIERAMAGNVRDRPTTAHLRRLLQQIETRPAASVDTAAIDSTLRAVRIDGRGSSRRAKDVREVVPTSDGPATNSVHRPGLPLELTSLVNRRTELSEAKKLLKTARLLTLTGVGGVGKTRLALRLAADLRRSFADGVWLVDLSELVEGALLVNVVVNAVGLRESSLRSLEEVLVEFARPRNVLLVFDSCEHVVDAVAHLAQLLLSSCSGVRIVATSRESLGVSGERSMHVPPLAIPDANTTSSVEGASSYDSVTLFIERARSIVSDFKIDEDNIHAVVGICRHLDGLPLSIEMAASRLRVMSAHQIGQNLGSRYKLLSQGNRSAPTRQQSLRLCIDWSYDLCSPIERKAWAQLSIFAGSFEIDAAEGLCERDAAPEYMADVLTSLVDKSILTRGEVDSRVRFRMLDSLREYGRERAARSGEYENLTDQHGHWYKKLALDAQSGWISPQQLGWIARLKREESNIREAIDHFVGVANVDAALEMTAALFPFWLSQGQLTEGRRWLDQSLSLRPNEGTKLRVNALFACIVLAGIQGDIVAGAKRFEEASALVAGLSDPVADARIAVAGGGLALWSGDHQLARLRLEHALTTLGAREEFMLRIPALMLLGLALAIDGDHGAAAACHEDVLEITEPRGESVYRSYSLWATGIDAIRQGHYGDAGERLERALVLASRADDLVAVAGTLESLAWTASHEGDSTRSAVLMGAAEILGSSVDTSSIIYPELIVHHNDSERSCRSALGDKAFEEAYSNGRRLGIDSAVAYALRVRQKAAPRRDDTSLTQRELQVAGLVAEGLTNKAIAARLGISQRTASGHVEHILSKLGFTSRAQIAAWIAEQRNRDRSNLTSGRRGRPHG
ncbi:MAG: protein kinase [Alcaligenaceae bacterium]|nr:MAG: protein kinase [Alcaligenaceae bacterium]